MRTLAKDVAGKIDKPVTVQGWLHKKRMLGGLNFINIRDRSGLVQVLVEKGEEIEKLRGLQIGTVLEVTGTGYKDDRAPGGAEIHDPELTVLVAVNDEPPIEIDKPLSHKSEHLDTLLDNRVLGLRNLQEQTIFKVQSTIVQTIRKYFEENEFTEIRTPKLLAEPTEGGAEVFTMEYFGKTATLAQSPQFYKQIMVGVFERVFEIAPVYRAEPSATTRHMTEYISIDGEMGFITLKELENFLSGMLHAAVDAVWEKHEAELKRWNATRPVLTDEIPEISIQEIHEMYLKATKEDFTAEDDLAPAEERWICEWAKKNKGSEAVFVTGWSAKSKTFKFYHRANAENPELADRVDLLFRGLEITTGSMRENSYEKVVEQLKNKAGSDPEDPGFAPILTAMKYGMPVHGGFGMGLERLTEKIIGLSNVKEASLFPRDINRLAP